MTGTSETAPHQIQPDQEDWTWCPHGDDEVRNGFPTREAAIEAARAWVTSSSGAPSYKISIGLAVDADPTAAIPEGDDIIQFMVDKTEGDVEGGMWLAGEMGWLDVDSVQAEHVKILTDAIRPVIKNWMEKYGYAPKWWHVPEEETIEIEATPPEIETMPAAGTA